MLSCFNIALILILFSSLSSLALTTYKGLILNAKTNERLEGVTLSSNNIVLAVSDKYGYVQFQIDTITSITVHSLGFEEKQLFLIPDEGKEQSLIIRLIPKIIELHPITIKGNIYSESNQLNVYTFHPGELSRIPQFGEVDVFRAFLAFPGVTSSSDFSSQISVRGGNFDETLIALDGMPLLNPYHVIGAFSVINSDLLANEKLYLSNYPVNYGGYLSSVLELNTKSGNTERIKGNVSVGLVSTKALMEGPLGNGTFVISARRTYMELISALFKGKFPYSFYDLYSKYVFQIDKSNLISFSGLYTKDTYDLQSDSYFAKVNPQWGNQLFNFTFLHNFKERQIFEIKFFSSSAFLNCDTRIEYADQRNGVIIDSTFVDNSTKDITAQLKYNFFLREHELSIGLELKRLKVHYNWTIDETDLNGLLIHPLENVFYDFADNPFCYDDQSALLSFYTSGTINTNRSNYISIGLRNCYMNKLKKLILLPSFTYFHKFSNSVKVSVGYGFYFQYLYTLRDINKKSLLSPFTVTFPAKSLDEIALTNHYSTRIVFESALDKTSLEIEGFYKYRTNLATSYKENNIVYKQFEKGYALGIDVLLKKAEGDITGWIGYSFLKSVKKNLDYVYYAPFDRTHNFKIIMNYAAFTKWHFNLFWTYSTGLPYTPTAAKFIGGPNDNGNEDSFWPIEGRRNSARFEDYHRLDVGFTVSFLWGSVLIKPYLQILNVYNSRNPYDYKAKGYYIDTKSGELRGSNFIPTFGITAEL